jgi:hypothetical protein
MPAPPDASRETLILAGSLAVVTVGLAARQVFARRRRGDLDAGEAAFYRGQDRRRALVAVVLAVISGMLAFCASIDVQAGRVQARIWVWAMIGVLVLALALLLLALLDWRANHLHAIRQGRALVEEQRALIADALRHHHESRRTPQERHDGTGPRP